MIDDDTKNPRAQFPFKVNGVALQNTFEKLVALDILKIARENGAIPRKPEDYLLKGQKREYKPHDWVNLTEDNEFIAVSSSPTMVA